MREPSEPVFSTFRTGYELSQAEIAERYDRITEAITMPNYFYPYVAQLSSRYMPDGALLDVGCGNGYLLDALARQAAARPRSYFGLERSPALAKSASTLLAHRATIVVGSGMQLPFVHGSFSVVFLSEVLEHVPFPVRLLLEAKRVLASDGVLIATMPNMSAYEPFWRLANVIPSKWLRDRLLPSEHPARTVQPIDTAYVYPSIRRLFAYAGLQVIALHGREHFAPWIHIAPVFGRLIWQHLSRWDAAAGAIASPRWAYRLFIVAKRA